MSDRQPIGAGEDGLVYGFMNKIDFDHELGKASDGNSIYPSAETLKSRCPGCNRNGVVKVSVKTLEEDPPPAITAEDDKIVVTEEEGVRVGYMDHKSLYFELGIADMGSRIFPSRECCGKEEGRRTERGVYPVEVRLVEVTQEAIEHQKGFHPRDLKFKREPRISANPYPMLLDLASSLRDELESWIGEHLRETYSVPIRCQPPYLLNVLKNIEKYCSDVDYEPEDLISLCKMHRGIGHVRSSMVMLGISTWDEIREYFYQARIAFPEVPEDELRAHLDPDHWFHLDIGGES